VDVVDEQLDVARVAQETSEDADRDTHSDEDEEMRQRVPVRRPEAFLEEVEQPDVGAADESADKARDHDIREQSPLLPEEPLYEELARTPKTEAACLHKYIVVRAISLLPR
jgi:hypothetical protein